MSQFLLMLVLVANLGSTSFKFKLLDMSSKNGEVIGEPSLRQRPERFGPDHPRYHRYEAYLVLARRVEERLAARA